MIEIQLEELEDWYIQQLNQVYSKYKKALKKFLVKLEQYIIELKNNLNIMHNRKDEVEIDEKSKVFVDRFYEKVKQHVESLVIPSDPTADEVYDMMDKIKRVFLDIGEVGRKNIPRIGELFKQEIVGIDMITRKISEQLAKIDAFLRKKYAHVREAERLIKRIPKLLNIIERISNAKSTIENLEKQKNQIVQELDELEKNLLNLEADPLFKKKKVLEERLVKLRMEFDDKIKFKKALKKLRKKIEKSGAYKGLTASKVRNYLTDPLNNIATEGAEHKQLTDFLIQLRYLLEHNPEFLQLKSEIRQKTIENINQIVENKVLVPMIEEYLKIKEELADIKKKLEKKNLDTQIESIKESISLKTQTSQHFENDLKNKQNEYRQLLEKLKQEREEIHQKIKEYIGQDVKINITLKY
ncbi:MAG: hypothetical protein ACTSRZ_10185 [Promethearchaeota archaeon]